MKLLHGQAKVLYFLWIHDGFRGNIPQLSDKLGYSDDRYVRGVVQDLQDAGLLSREAEDDGIELFKITEKGRQNITFLTLPTWAYRTLLMLGALITFWGVEQYYGTLPSSPTSVIGVGIAILAIGAYLVMLRRRSFDSLWPREAEGQNSPKGG